MKIVIRKLLKLRNLIIVVVKLEYKLDVEYTN